MQGDEEASIDFLRKWSKDGPWVLTAIQTDRKKIETRTFKSDEITECRKWFWAYNGNRNIYFHVNSCMKDMKSKAHKEDIKAAGWLHIDIDPEPGETLEEGRERALGLLTDKIPKGIPKPTVIIFSGGGYQGFWKLSKEVVVDGDVKKCEDFELYNKRLEQVFGGDHCHNIDRIMRLPGTINIPNEKKKKAGRVEELAVCFEFNKNEYDISEFKKAQGVQIDSHQGGEYGVSVSVPGNVERIQDLSELDEWDVPDRVKVIVAQGRHPDQPKEGDNSRSAWLFDCICQLFRSGVPDEVVYAIITDRDWGIAESVLESKNPEKYAVRQMTRAKEHAEDPNLRMMNERHAIIGNLGGKCRVIEEVQDEIMNRSRLTISSFEDLRNRYSNIMVDVGSDKEGKPIQVPLGKYWINHRMRRQFDYMRFMPQGDIPGVYNLWRGFSFEPKPGDCSLYLNHLRDNVCGGVEEYYIYLTKWMARAIQVPASPGEVAVVMRGGKGTGKSLMATLFGKLFGRHHLHVANPSHLVGNFNAHLRDVICLFADEAFFAGDKKHESVLKMLVTEDSIPIEQKGVDVETYPNYVHLIMAANDPHVIRASGDERRYFVLEVADGAKQNKQYFGDIVRQMESGGFEALLFHLQNIDLEGFQVREVPQTDALQEQKLLSMSVDEEWWFRKLQNGRLVDSDAEWTEAVPCDTIISDFTTYAEKWKFSRRGNETALGRFLTRVCPHIERTQKRVAVDVYNEDARRNERKKKRLYFYDFKDLKKCRNSWEKIYGRVVWETEVDGADELIKEPF